ncbi:MAG: phage tail length tape measure family protein [Marinovum algicola]|uniref:phage tail length tape measure family protein n=1 Tax=Marinovum algicola TaxID=42444 RepID=UPI0032ED74EE
MTFKVSLLIDADGKAAVQEVKRVEAAQRDAGRASDELGRKSRTAAGGVSTLGSSASGAEAQVDHMADANRRAAGSMGNLVAQGNDVITMLMAGQDPMQLAIQQGTQINQVWGQMGVKGRDAFRLVGGAIMSMMSPINLITIGSIAAAGAMTKWFASGGEEAKTFEEVLSELEEAMTAYTASAEAAEVGTDELREKFGAAAGQVRRLLEDQQAAARRDLTFKIKARIEADVDESLFGRGDESALHRMAQEFGVSLFDPNAEVVRARRGMVNEVLSDYAELARAADGSVAQQAAAVESLIASYTRAAQASGDISKAENDRIITLQELLIKLREMQALEPDQGAIPTAQREAYREYYQSRIRGEEFLQNAREREAASLQEIYGLYAQTRIESDANAEAAGRMLAELEGQVELQHLIARHGEDSAEVAEHRAATERAVFEEMLATNGAAESLNEEARVAFETLQAISGIDVGAGIRGAVGEAMQLADWLGILLETAAKLAAMGPQGAPGSTPPQGGRGGDPRDQGGGFSDWQNRDAIQFLENWKPPRISSRGGRRRGSGGGSSRATEAQKERDAVADLIRSLEDQLAILRETDPIQKEMLRNREALKGATDAEREAVRDLIGVHAEEERALERKGELTSFLKDEGYDLFTSATKGVDALTAAAERAAEALADAVFQAILLGEGPLAGIIGGSGLLTGIAEGLADALGGTPKTPQALAAGGMVGGEAGTRPAQRPTAWRTIDARAAGGMIYGKGGGTSDDNLTWTSNGEYVVNARATARNRGLLERINAGAEFPALAQGGMVGGGSSGGGAVAVSFTVENRSSAPVAGEVEEVAAPGGGRAYRMVLSDMVGEAIATPGGGARRQLRQGYGIKPRGTKR